MTRQKELRGNKFYLTNENWIKYLEQKEKAREFHRKVKGGLLKNNNFQYIDVWKARKAHQGDDEE